MGYKSTFITLKAADPLTDDEGAFNIIHLRPIQVIQFEPYSGPFRLQAYGPDGNLALTGQSKQVLGGSMVLLGGNGGRIVYDTPSEILAKIKEAEADSERSFD